MVGVVYTDEGPTEACGAGLCYTRAAQGLFLFDTAEDAAECVSLHTKILGRKNARVVVLDTDNGDIIRDRREGK